MTSLVVSPPPGRYVSVASAYHEPGLVLPKEFPTRQVLATSRRTFLARGMIPVPKWNRTSHSTIEVIADEWRLLVASRVEDRWSIWLQPAKTQTSRLNSRSMTPNPISMAHRHFRNKDLCIGQQRRVTQQPKTNFTRWIHKHQAELSSQSFHDQSNPAGRFIDLFNRRFK